MLGLDHSCLPQDVRSNCRFAELRQSLQAHDIEFLAEDVGESALRHTPVQRHLTTFKSADHARPTARTLSFVSAGGRLTHAGSHAASNTLALLSRLLRSMYVR